MHDDSPNPFQSPEAELSPQTDEEQAAQTDYRRRKRNVLLALGVYAAFSGLPQGILEEGNPLLQVVELSSLIAVAVAVIAWCRLDSDEHDIHLWSFFPLMVLCCPGPAITLVVYLFVSRGRGGFLATAKLLAYVAVLFAVLMAAALLAAGASALLAAEGG